MKYVQVYSLGSIKLIYKINNFSNCTYCFSIINCFGYASARTTNYNDNSYLMAKTLIIDKKFLAKTLFSIIYFPIFQTFELGKDKCFIGF